MENSELAIRNKKQAEENIHQQLIIVSNALVRLSDLESDHYTQGREAIGPEHSDLKELPGAIAALTRLAKELTILEAESQILFANQEIYSKSQQVSDIQKKIEEMRESLLVR